MGALRGLEDARGGHGHRVKDPYGATHATVRVSTDTLLQAAHRTTDYMYIDRYLYSTDTLLQPARRTIRSTATGGLEAKLSV